MNRMGDAATRRPPGEPNSAGSGRRGEGDRGAHGRPTEDPCAPLPSRVSDVPELPPEVSDAIRIGLVALRIDDASGSILAALAGHLRLLLAWTVAINLTSIRDPAQAARRHLFLNPGFHSPVAKNDPVNVPIVSQAPRRCEDGIKILGHSNVAGKHYAEACR